MNDVKTIMNPIDKITESTFTNSAKGLLTLFCIGLFHAVIGVDLTDAKIAVPWLPTVSFEHVERLAYLYWGLVAYSIYRYCLYNIHIMKRYYFLALGKFLSTTKSGSAFINRNIFDSSLEHNVVIDEGNDTPVIKIEHYDDVGSGWEKMATFDFIYSSDYTFEKIECSENPGYQNDDLAFNKAHIRKSWGLTNFIDEFENDAMTTSLIQSASLKSRLRASVLFIYFRILLGSKEVFDLLLPVILNLVLSLYCLFFISLS
ncbi:hypothetical protein [Vibrio owensii]|uniref:hypothetical protein n=1 Tax=Vibrio owensii TaxID=696485 RepID=UPI0018F27861|nr:hypothetical protein [Vibrio owensii]